MEPASPTVLKLIQYASATFEDSLPNSTGYATKVIQVTWTHVHQVHLGDGEWSVFWDTEDGDAEVENINTTSATQESEELPAAAEELETLDDGYFDKLFQQRSVVQTPTKILPPSPPPQNNNALTPITPNSHGQKLTAYFLLSKNAPIPKSVTIRFTPTWASPILRPPTVNVPVTPASSTKRGDMHRAWAKSRLADLNELKELADELACTGQRGVGTGTLKVGVDGGGHDEERVQWEAEMVGREWNWVLKNFLGELAGGKVKGKSETGHKGDTTGDLTEQREVEEGLEMLGKLAEVLKVDGQAEDAVNTTTINLAGEPTQVEIEEFKKNGGEKAQQDEDDDEEDLFALPLSPRSPEMEVSPFSFRGPAVGSLNAALASTVSTISTTLSASKDAIAVDGGTPLTPTLASPSPSELRKKRLAGSPGSANS